jgi:hypothetical protein
MHFERGEKAIGAPNRPTRNGCGSGAAHERLRAIAIDAMRISGIYKHAIRNDERNSVGDESVSRSPARGRRRLFEPRQSANPAGRRPGLRNKATLAAAALLDGEALGLTRTAVEAALAGDMLAIELCLERVLPPCHERPATMRRRPARQFVQGSVFNLQDKFSCRFSADAGGGITLCNSWLMVRKAARGCCRGRRRRRANRPLVGCAVGEAAAHPANASIAAGRARPRRAAAAPGASPARPG